MADRSVVYRLIADATRFKSGMAEAGTSAQKAAGQMDGAAKSGGKMSQGMDMLGISAGTAAAAIGAKVVMSAANFEQAMSGIQAATRASAADMALMEQAALDAGASTAFSATEAAAGIENLAKAGVSTKDILGGGLTGALDLAAAGSLDVGQAAEIAATAMTQFNLAGSDVSRVADSLAAGAGKAQGEVTDLAQALNQSGLVAGQMGLSLEETTGTLSAFASAGLLGSDAGTSLKTMLLRLANPSKQARDAMREFGISAYDANGNMVNTATLAGQLQAAFEGETQASRDAAMATIFGSDAIRAANVLYSEGQEGIAGWTTEVSDSGFAAETAAIKMDNLKGRFEELMGALETAQIGQGDGALGPLSAVLSGATEGINAFNKLNSATDGWVTTLASGPVTQFPRMFGDIKTALGGAKNEGDAFSSALDNATGGLLSASRASGTLEGGSEALGKAVALSAEELKAQADALQDARDAATDTARGFVNLGDSLDDAKVSLGEWIREMANQADALQNFTANAKRAADQGLRKGLINALEEAGTAGALRMKQLANATDSEIARANKAWGKGQQAINEYVNATTKVPRSVSTEVRVASASAMAALAQARRELDALDGRTANAIATVTTVYKTVGNATDAFPRRAAGGPIYGPGTATSDSIPAMLSDGEYVIRAAAVAKYGLGFFDKANNMRLAGGGSPDKGKDWTRNGMQAVAIGDSQDFIKQLIRQLGGLERAIDRTEKASERQTKAIDKQTEATDKATSDRDAILGQMSALSQATTAGFRTALFESQTEEVAADPAWMGGGRGSRTVTTGGWLENLSTDIAGLQERSGLQAQLAAAGLDGAALEEALSQGTNEDLASLLAGGGVQQFEDMFNQRAALMGSVGAEAGQIRYGSELAAQEAILTSQLAELQNQRDELQLIKGELKLLNREERQREARREAREERNADRTGEKVGEAINGAAATGQRASANRPNQGRRGRD